MRIENVRHSSPQTILIARVEIERRMLRPPCLMPDRSRSRPQARMRLWTYASSIYDMVPPSR